MRRGDSESAEICEVSDKADDANPLFMATAVGAPSKALGGLAAFETGEQPAAALTERGDRLWLDFRRCTSFDNLYFGNGIMQLTDNALEDIYAILSVTCPPRDHFGPLRAIGQQFIHAKLEGLAETTYQDEPIVDDVVDFVASAMADVLVERAMDLLGALPTGTKYDDGEIYATFYSMIDDYDPNNNAYLAPSEFGSGRGLRDDAAGRSLNQVDTLYYDIEELREGEYGVVGEADDVEPEYDDVREAQENPTYAMGNTSYDPTYAMGGADYDPTYSMGTARTSGDSEDLYTIASEVGAGAGTDMDSDPVYGLADSDGEGDYGTATSVELRQVVYDQGSTFKGAPAPDDIYTIGDGGVDADETYAIAAAVSANDNDATYAMGDNDATYAMGDAVDTQTYSLAAPHSEPPGETDYGLANHTNEDDGPEGPTYTTADALDIGVEQGSPDPVYGIASDRAVEDAHAEVAADGGQIYGLGSEPTYDAVTADPTYGLAPAVANMPLSAQADISNSADDFTVAVAAIMQHERGDGQGEGGDVYDNPLSLGATAVNTSALYAVVDKSRRSSAVLPADEGEEALGPRTTSYTDAHIVTDSLKHPPGDRDSYMKALENYRDMHMLADDVAQSPQRDTSGSKSYTIQSMEFSAMEDDFRQMDREGFAEDLNLSDPFTPAASDVPLELPQVEDSDVDEYLRIAPKGGEIAPTLPRGARMNGRRLSDV